MPTGIIDDITAELARNRAQFVVARNTSLKRPAAHYVLDGSVRRNGGRVRVVAQLIEAETCEYIWAERYNRELSDIFSLQDEIATAVAAAIQPAIADAELRRILRKPVETVSEAPKAPQPWRAKPHRSTQPTLKRRRHWRG